MLKQVFAFILTFAVFTGNLFAQANKNNGKSDPEAKKVLDAVSAKFKTFKSVKANFTLKIENAAGKVQGTKTGTVLMKGLKYRVMVQRYGPMTWLQKKYKLQSLITQVVP
jgi:outer membrane lipoprotein-sorting protein